MNKVKITMFLAVLVLAAVITSCGKDNTSRPYETSWGSSIIVGDSIAAVSNGKPFVFFITAYVVDENNVPLDQMDIGLFLGIHENGSSYGSRNVGGLTVAKMVNRGEVAYWDDYGNPHYITDIHGRIIVSVFAPEGFAGSIDAMFFTHTADAVVSITVTASGGQCFDGIDNETVPDGNIDAWDQQCEGIDDLDESN